MDLIYLILLATGLGSRICRSKGLREDEKLPEFLESYPFFATISHNDEPICMGTIVSGNFILCPRSCVEGKSLSSLKVRVHSLDALIGGTSEQVKSLILNPMDTTVALIELAQKIVSNAIDQVSIKLFQPGKESAVGLHATLVCLASRLSEESRPLKALEAQILADAECERGSRLISNTMICVAVPADLLDLCPNGILGAPIIVNGHQIGMISTRMYPLPGRAMTEPMAYQNVIPYAAWIHESTGEGVDH